MTEIVELRHGAACVRIAPSLGGRITDAELECADGSVARVLHPYPESVSRLLPWAKGGMYPLVPYSGRIRNARLMHDGTVHQLTPHPGGEPHTLHGIAQQRPWRLEHLAVDEAVLCYAHEPDGHWPWHFEARLAVVLRAMRLDIDVALTNSDRRQMPAGIGLHPYLPYRRGDRVAFDAAPAWPSDADYLALPASPGMRTHVEVPAAQFQSGDVTQFHADWAGRMALGGLARTRICFGASGALRHLVIHRPAHAGYVCIEPVSHVADGFNLHAQGVVGTGTRVLEPGETLRGGLRVRVERRDPGTRA